jgi:type I restriction enzyme M protein
MITNPPFGVSWKSEQDYIQTESQNPLGRFSVGFPRVSDGSLLFLQHMVSKMKPEGSRIGVVFNGSPMFTGDSGSGVDYFNKIYKKD